MSEFTFVNSLVVVSMCYILFIRYPRVAFDLSYFLIITTVLMNVIFGIILDTFGALRDETQERGEYMRQNTFISTIPRQDIDKCAQKMNVQHRLQKCKVARSSVGRIQLGVRATGVTFV